MSRCLPFPPPGYVWQGVSGDALIELIKVRREKADAEKRRKKEKRKRRKEKEEVEEGEIRQKRHSHRKRHKYHESKKGSKRNDDQMKTESELQVLERSNLTEELEQPAISDSRYDSSDNSQNIKRKEPSWSPESYQKHGDISLTDVQLPKHMDQEALFSKPVCSTATRDFIDQEKSELAHSLTKAQFSSTFGECGPINDQSISTFAEPTTTALELARPCRGPWSSSPQANVNKDEKSKLALESSYSESGLQKVESKFRELIVNWVPPPLRRRHLESENLEWLFETRTKRPPRSEMIEKSNERNDNQSHPSYALYPAAQYLPEVHIVALPFTLPF